MTPSPAEEGSAKRSFDVGLALERIAAAVAPYPQAALFELAEEGYSSVFQQVAACIISIRTRDETTIWASRRLFERARNPTEMAGLGADELAGLIQGSAFAATKAAQIKAIARGAVERWAGEVPCDFEVLTSFAGVGPKCANLALGIACGEARIGVDTHVHRITNRWGYVESKTPEATMQALEATLPQRYWVEINRLLVPFGKHICTSVSPRCSGCPVLDLCERRGVTSSR